jgi:hypothetical protein
MRVGSTLRQSVHVCDFADFCRSSRRLASSASCSSRQRFASSFLQFPSPPGHPCLWLTLPRVGRVEDFHLQVSAPCRAHKRKAR